jgi:hypothetical protein
MVDVVVVGGVRRSTGRVSGVVRRRVCAEGGGRVRNRAALAGSRRELLTPFFYDDRIVRLLSRACVRLGD